ncbi:MAG: xanthine dehydrogenase family protein molybdopterin-binding subunit [Thermovirgaceae bacterium]
MTKVLSPVKKPEIIEKKAERDLKYVGRDVKRVDIERKIKGRFNYLADLPPGGSLHARLILSKVANGRVLSIDDSKALEIPGVIKVFTPVDDPGVRFNSQVSMPNQEDFRDERIFTDRPLFVGDRIGAVLATDPRAAQKAADLVKVEYETFEPIVDPEQALSSSPLLEGRPQIIEGRISYGDGEADEKGLVAVESVVRTPKIHHAALENHICLAYVDYDGTLTVESPCQMIFTVRHILAQTLGLPLNKVRVIKAPVGGSFGGKQDIILEPACALMAIEAGRPVRLAMDREEAIIATRTRTATIGKVKTLARPDGTLVFRRMDIISDAGAYLTGGHRVTMAMGKKTSRLYRIPSQVFVGKTTYTNTTPSGACRGFGSPQIHAATEINLDFLAKKLGMDPALLRLKNLVYPGDLDPTGAPALGNARVRECLELGMERFDWKRRYRMASGTGRYRRGVGLACSTHGNGYYGTPYPDFTGMSLRLCEDGSAILNAGFHELGNGTLTAMAQIVGEILDIPPERIYVTEGDTQHSPFDTGCIASRVTYVCGACALELAEKVKDRFIRQIGRLYGEIPEDIKFENGYVYIKGKPAGDYGTMVIEIANRLNEEVGDFLTYTPEANPASYGVHFAEVEVDTFTGLVRVTDFLAAHDVGKAINPRMVKGQIYGGVQMGIGMALTEEMLYDPSGRPKNASLGRYHLVNAPDMPDVDIILVEKNEPGGPFGGKSIGEISTVPTAAAVVNAINRALDTQLTHLPLTPERILDALSICV